MAPKPRVQPARKLYWVEPLKWCRALRNVQASPMAKLVGHTIAMHVNVGNHRARVGVLRLAYESGTSKSTAIRAIAELERLGLLYCEQRGSIHGRQKIASTYILTTYDGMPTTAFDDWLTDHGLERTGVTEELDPWEQESA